MIGYAMLYTGAVSVPIASAALLGARFLRNHGRPERAIWIFAIAATLLVPAFMLSRPATSPTAPWLPPIQVGTIDVSDVMLPIQADAPPAPPPMDLDVLLLCAWALGSLVLVLRWLISAVRLRVLTGSWLSETVDGVHVWLTSELGPAVTGVLWPRVVLPAWVPALPERQRALVLLHEQEHLRARDPLLMLFAKLARVVTPWNPVSWLLALGLERAVELDCDRRVLRRYPDVQAYGETLLVVSARGSNRLLAATAFAETDVPLRKRILAMTTPPRRMTVMGVAVTLVSGVILVTGAVALPAPVVRIQRSSPEQVSPDVDSVVAGDAEIHRALEISPETPQPLSAFALARADEQSTAPEPKPPIPQAQQPLLPEPRVIRNPRRSWLQGGAPQSPVFIVSLPRANIPLIEVDTRSFPSFDSLRSALLRADGSADSAGVGNLADSLRLAQLLGSPRVQILTSPQVSNPQDIIRAIAEAYPPTLRERGLGGTVGMQFLVGATGEVQDTRIGQISAFPAIDEAALVVADVYRFSPASAADGPIAVWVAHAIDFRPEP